MEEEREGDEEKNNTAGRKEGGRTKRGKTGRRDRRDDKIDR